MRYFLFLLAFFASFNRAHAGVIDEAIDKYFSPFSDVVSTVVFYPIDIAGAKLPITILILIVASIVFTFYLRWPGIWGFAHSLKVILSSTKTHDGHDGEVSSFQALATALSGTVGLGNIAGVAIAISLGGPGAMFWMIFGAIFGMATKFIESYMGVKYRKFNPDGTVSGGPMYYIAHGLARKKKRRLGQALALIFAIALIPCTFGGGNMLQVNQAAQQMITITGGENSFFYHHAWVFGLIVALIVGSITIGGIKSISRVTAKLVPFMCILYVASALIIIAMHITEIPNAIALIIKDAFMPQAVSGGVIGCIVIGLRRSIQSNEAGSGSAPIAYAAVKTKEPVSQGFVALMEPFIDTVVICSITALVIILTGAYKNYSDGISGVELTSSAFATVAPFFPYILAVVIILFALSTVLSWSYYGQKGWTYLFGEGKKRVMAYQLLFCTVIVIGSAMNLKSIIDFTDATYLAMAMPNLIALFIMMPEIKKDVISYCKRFNVGLNFNKVWFTSKE